MIDKLVNVVMTKNKSSNNASKKLSLTEINIHNLQILLDDFSSKVKDSRSAFADKSETVEALKIKTKNSFSDIRKMLNDKEHDLLAVLDEIDFRKDYLKKEICEVLKKIEEIFSQDQLSKLKSEENILTFFSEKEKECTDYIKKSFKDNKFLHYYIKSKMEEIFTKNPTLSDITKDINSKIRDLSSSKFQSENEYKEKLATSFGNTKLPDFLIDNDIKNLKYKLFLINNRPKENNILIECYEKIRLNEIKILEGINNKYELFLLFVIVNNSVFHKDYFGKKFFNFLEINENLIKEYFGENIQYKEIFEKFNQMDEKQEKNEIDYLYQIIEKEINEDANKLINIISSFYFILLYILKDHKRYRDISNIGNDYIDLILKNFVIFLDKKYKSKIKLENSLFQLFKELSLFDIKFLIEQKLINSENKAYSYNDISQILLKDEKLKELYLTLDDEFLLNDDPLSIVRKNMKRNFHPDKLEIYEENINLVPINNNINSNTITIIIDGYADEKNKKEKKKDINSIAQNTNRLKEWNDFIGYFKNETNIYFYNWADASEKQILWNGDKKKIIKKNENYKISRNKAKLSGKLLAYILYSFKFFKEFQINLIGFGLGNNVIKQCLKELYGLNNVNKFITIKNVILISAVNHMKKIYLWKKYMEDIIIDKFINCYSTVDEILKALSLIGGEENKNLISAGNKALLFKNSNGVNMVLNYDFTQNKFDHMSYKFGIVAQKICEEYKDI